ncbi:MAG: hypothetical protein R3E35_12345 [Rhodocyclaceae bacterium]
MHIAILGWGSLLWDEKPEFDNQHGPWEFDGPELRIEFSRISQTRGGALTLVIDPANGSICHVAHARSKRRDPEDAICDLRSREGTTRANIGIHFADGSLNQSKDPITLTAIATWAKSKGVDVVVWTDLPSNFQKVCGSTFSIASAVAHIRALDEGAKSGAAEYVWRAPAFVNTPLRSALQTEPWFKS